MPGHTHSIPAATSAALTLLSRTWKVLMFDPPTRVTPLQREVEPPPTCTRCGRSITTLSGLYRCAQCHAAFDLACIKEHFGSSVNDKPHSPLAATPEQGPGLDDHAVRQALPFPEWSRD